MKICIGIISYLPDNNDIREKRLNKLNQTIKSCNKYFNLPIMIIAQNWKENEVDVTDNCIIYYYDKLMITKARNTLREKFLESEFDYIVLLDDDCVLKGVSAQSYILEVEKYKDDCLIKYDPQFKLFGISKLLFNEIKIPSCEAELCQGNEDIVFFAILKSHYSDRLHYIQNNDLYIDEKESFMDSTWRSIKIDPFLIMDNTNKLVNYVRQINPLLEEEN